jgi:hypothetical protein
MGLSPAGILIVFMALAVVGQGCGIFDPDPEPPKKEPLPPMPPDSPQAVIDNMEYAYNFFKYEERYQPLIRDDFVFIFNPDDVETYPDQIPPDGWWGAPEEKLSAKNMLDANFEPSDPQYKIDSMNLVIQLSGQLLETNQQGAPEGTLEAYVTFDLEVQAGGGQLTLLVSSRPLFFFAPDDPDAENKVWRLWQIKDAPFDDD